MSIKAEHNLVKNTNKYYNNIIILTLKRRTLKLDNLNEKRIHCRYYGLKAFTKKLILHSKRSSG